ncbi:MAG: hypothetical protein K0U98_19475 [Deltaproteobacteria bacterium]|nr:hypothetical protein [Deltaproteobacteria bacterium]
MFQKSIPFAVFVILCAFALSPVFTTAVQAADLDGEVEKTSSAAKVLQGEDLDSDSVGVLDGVMQFVSSLFKSSGQETSNAGNERPWDRGPGFEPTGSPAS